MSRVEISFAILLFSSIANLELGALKLRSIQEMSHKGIHETKG